MMFTPTKHINDEIIKFCKQKKILFVDDFKSLKKKPKLMPTTNQLVRYFGNITKTNEYLFDKIGLIKRNDIENSKYVSEIKKYCEKNNLFSTQDYRKNHKNFKETRIPNFSKIVSLLGSKKKAEIYLINKINLSSSDPRQKYSSDIFIKRLKKYFESKQIYNVADYDKNRDKKWMPSRERLRQLYGFEYMYEILGLKKIYNAEHLGIDECRQILLDNEIYSINEYIIFKKKYDSKNEIQLPKPSKLVGSFNKILKLTKKEIARRKIEKHYFSYTKNLNFAEKINSIISDNNLDKSKKMYFLLITYDFNDVEYSLKNLSQLVKNNYPNWNSYRTSYHTAKNKLINLGIIKGSIKTMNFISKEDETEIIKLFKKGFNPTQIAEWIKKSSTRRENRPGIIRVLMKHKLVK